MRYTQTERATLDALCRTIVPAAYETDSKVDLLSAVESRMQTLPRDVVSDVLLAIRIIGHPFASLLDFSPPRPFASLSAPGQDARLNRWQRSRIAFRRTIFQALRRLILSTYYAQPETFEDIGYGGPFRNRPPVVSWEGPVDSPGNRVITGRASSPAAPVRNDPRPHGSSKASAADSKDETAITDMTCDVLVIGSGAGGSVIAARLAEAGRDVIVIEEGPRTPVSSFTDLERDMIPALYADAGARATDDASISLLQGACIGGGTTVNWMLMLRPRGYVTDEWEKFCGVPMLSADSLIPAIESIERELGADFLPHDAHSPANRIILDGAAALGWEAEEARINANGCVRAGTCGLGCSHGAKRSAGAIFLPRAVNAGARVFANVRAGRIGGSASARQVECSILGPETRPSIHTITITASHVVLAAGAIGTPALLQRSGIASDGVGRYLRLHPTTAVTGTYDRTMYGAAGVPQSALLSEFLAGDDGYGFWVECPPMLPSLASVAVSGFGSSHRNVMSSFPNLAALIVLTRDGADRNRSNGSVTVDRRGRTRIRYALGPREQRALCEGIAAASRLHLAAGARLVQTLHNPAIAIRGEADIVAVDQASLAPNRMSIFSAHVNGTCRMGAATHAPCTPDGELRGEPGIWVADGSALPTAPGVNPQAIIMALASLVAERVIAAR